MRRILRRFVEPLNIVHAGNVRVHIRPSGLDISLVERLFGSDVCELCADAVLDCDSEQVQQ